MKSYSPLNLASSVAFNISTSVRVHRDYLYQFQCLFLFHNTSGYTSKHHLNFMHVTELQPCQNRSQTVTNTGFAFPMFVGSQRSSSKRPFNAYVSSDHLIKRTILVRGQLISSNGSLFCIPRRGVHLRELSLYFPL